MSNFCFLKTFREVINDTRNICNRLRDYKQTNEQNITENNFQSFSMILNAVE